MAQNQQTRKSSDSVRRRQNIDRLLSVGRRSEHVAAIVSLSTYFGRPDYLFDATWFELDERCGVLDLRELFGNVTLSLFLALPYEGGGTCGWWTTQDGVWLCKAHVGLA